MILGRIWKSIAAQFNKLANAIRGYDPIAEMQYEYDRSVEQIKEGREGLAQYRALVERVTRQVDESRKHVSLLEAKVKAYLNAGDRDTASKFALELKRAKDDSAENEKQLALHEQAYQNNLLKIQNAVKKLDDVKAQDLQVRRRAEDEPGRGRDVGAGHPVPFQRDDRLRAGRTGPAGSDRQEPGQGPGGRRPLGRGHRGDQGAKPPSKRPWPTTRCANSRCLRAWPRPRRPRFRRRPRSWGRRPKRWRRCRRFDVRGRPA